MRNSSSVDDIPRFNNTGFRERPARRTLFGGEAGGGRGAGDDGLNEIAALIHLIDHAGRLERHVDVAAALGQPGRVFGSVGGG